MSSNLNNNPNVNATIGSSSAASAASAGGHSHGHHLLQQQSGHLGGQVQGAGLNKETKSLNDRVKAFFKGLAKGTTVTGASGTGAGGQKLHPEYSSSVTCVLLTPELLADLSPSQPNHVRLKALQTLTEVCKFRKIEPHTVEKLWTQTSDLFSSPDTPTRHICFAAFTTIIQAQFEKPGFLRGKLFSFLKTHDKPEDTCQRFQLLKALSENGRDLSYFEEKVGPFLFGWMISGEVYGKTNTGVSVEEFMSLLTNVVKFNCSFLDDDVLGGIIQHTCITALTSIASSDTLSCINLLNTIVMYSMIPPNTLQTVIATLCRTVNVEPLCLPSWKVMRNLLGTHLGYSGLYTLIQFMNNELHSQQSASSPETSMNGSIGSGGVEMDSLVRGAVFYTGVALWGGGNRAVRSLTRGMSSGGGGGGIVGVVLAAYVKTLDRSNALITYEVLLRVQDLIRNNADSLQVIGWDLVLEIMHKIIDYSKKQDYQASLLPAGASCGADDKLHQQLLRNNQHLLSQIHQTLDLIEAVLPTKTFCGSTNKYWEEIVEPVCHSRPVPSMEKLLQHKHIKLLNSTTTSFLPNLVQFTHLHFQKEARIPLRLQALSLVQKICLLNQDTLEEVLLDNVILPNLKNIELESDLSVRQHCVQFIVEFLMESRSKKGHDLLHYIEKVVNRPYELEKMEQICLHQNSDTDVQDILVGISGIIRIFQRKIYNLPSSIAVTAFKILVRHLEKHYKAKGNCLEYCSSVRYKIFECFFRIRANALYHLGFPSENGVIEAYSSYLAVDHRDPRESGGDHGDHSYHYNSASVSPPVPLQQQQSQEKPGGPTVNYISLTAACKQVICCLKKERDWKILELVLLQLPNVMENKALILSRNGNDVDTLATQLCYMVTDKSFFGTSSSANDPSAFRNTPPRFSRSDFQSFVFPALTSLVSYHSSLEIKSQQQIVKCLEHGLVSKSSRICISALTTCTLEMKEVMHKLIPEILLSLSKISPKLNIAIPVLEFLSTLIHLPRVFASFVQDQYMSIFAICLPYTNPFKFNHYVVSLAHHVIALWFLKCRLSFRKGFVAYIIKGLESNVWAPYVEATEKHNLVNEDSSNRKRSSSLTDQSNRRRERIVSGQSAGLSRQSSYQPVDSVTIQFHQELTETCVDLMARYAFADCSPLPSRFESAGFLTQHGGNTQSWMIDNRIITISTSGCSQRELREGLCDRCWMTCKQQQQCQSNKRSILVGQHSYDEETRESPQASGAGVKRSNTISGSGGSGAYANPGGARRRHRSAMVQQQQQHQLQQQDTNSPPVMQHHDDLHLENKLTPTADGKIGERRVGGGRKDGASSQICMCWCQGWAEILIRRPTGNTSWMMRVQNVIGGNGTCYGMAGTERLVSNLGAMYINDILDCVKSEIDDGESGAGSDEVLSKGDETDQSMIDPESTSGEVGDQQDDSGAKEVETMRDGQRSPEEPPGEPKKTPVKRSNSSPEMAKTPPSSSGIQEGIGEEDENPQLQQTISSTYLPSVLSCVPIPEETTRKSESEEMKPPSSGSPPPLSMSSEPGLTLTPVKRDRMFTISVMTPARRNNAPPTIRRLGSVGAGDISRPTAGVGPTGIGSNDPGIRSGISPSFIFLQLCGQGIFGCHTSSKPLPLPCSDTTTNSLKVLDYIPPYETHKIGVLYVGPGQTRNEPAIFQNSHGSLRYRDFLQGLGTLIKLNEADPQKIFLGGLDGKGVEDGEFAYIWKDDVMQVIFHVATLMPTRVTTDPNCNGKKKHIGNDFVAIVYNNSEEEFDISTIKCQFMYACVIIQPLDHRANRVFVKAKPTLAEHIGHTDVKIVSDQNLPIMARQLALHSNLASVIHWKLSQNSEPYASNWLERLRHIKRLRARLIPDSQGNSSGTSGLSVSAQELSESLGGGGTGSTGNIGGSTVPKRNSFVVDDFTEYV